MKDQLIIRLIDNKGFSKHIIVSRFPSIYEMAEIDPVSVMVKDASKTPEVPMMKKIQFFPEGEPVTQGWTDHMQLIYWTYRQKP